MKKLLPIGNNPTKILHWDLENKPLTYMGNDYTSSDITAIACSWSEKPKVYSWVLGQCTALEMINGFLEFYNQAEIVTGHFLRRHDMPMLNSACLEFGLPLLSPKLVSDTYLDLVKRKDFSASQESLSGMFRLPEAKHHMGQYEWRQANRFSKEGMALTKKRVVDDVIQHKQLRSKLIDHGALKGPKLWKP